MLLFYGNLFYAKKFSTEVHGLFVTLNNIGSCSCPSLWPCLCQCLCPGPVGVQDPLHVHVYVHDLGPVHVHVFDPVPGSVCVRAHVPVLFCVPVRFCVRVFAVNEYNSRKCLTAARGLPGLL
jgi:hypothetical protein